MPKAELPGNPGGSVLYDGKNAVFCTKYLKSVDFPLGERFMMEETIAERMIFLVIASTGKLIFMIVIGLLAFALPIGYAVWLRKKKGADVLPFFVGCLIFVVFALVLEPQLHKVALKAPFIVSNIWVYCLYGGLAAGVFEEVGRYVGMRFLMKKKSRRPVNALMYGAGHGGIEAMILVGLNLISYAVIAMAFQAGASWPVTAMGGESNLNLVLQSVMATSTSMLPVALLERILAITLHVSLSVVVYAGVVRHKVWYLLAAILGHMVVDSAVLAVNTLTGKIWLSELVCAVLVVVITALAIRLYKSLKKEADATAVPTEAEKPTEA